MTVNIETNQKDKKTKPDDYRKQKMKQQDITRTKEDKRGIQKI